MTIKLYKTQFKIFEWDEDDYDDLIEILDGFVHAGITYSHIDDSWSKCITVYPYNDESDDSLLYKCLYEISVDFVFEVE